MARHYRARLPQTCAPSLCRRQGEGRGGGGFEASCTASVAVYAAPTRAVAWSGRPCRAEPCSAGAFPVRPLPSMARHYGLPPPFAEGKGRAGEGAALGLHARPASRFTPLPQGPLRGREGHVEPSHARLGRSSVKLLPSMARHYALPPPFAAGEGRAGEGSALGLHARPASRLTPLPQGPVRGQEGVVEPSHARLGRSR